MKRIFLFVILVLAGTAASAQPESRIVTDSLYSNVLQCMKEYNVYLPEHYDENQDKSYPVLYLLHGLSGDNHNWNKLGRVCEVMEHLLGEGKVCEMIVVMPDADADIPRAEHGYFNHQNWAYEDYFFTEFMPCVEGRYRIAADKRCRAIAGLSMGGGGTVFYAQRHPELFCAVYAMSAFVRVCKSRPITDDMTNKVNLMRILARENDCVSFVENVSDSVKEQLKTVSWFVDCGDDDHLFEVNMEFVLSMKDAGIPVQLRVREGGHKWEYWRTALHICLPYLTRQFRG